MRHLLARAPAHARPQLWVRVNARASGELRADLDAVFAGGAPYGIVLPKVSAAEEIAEAADYLATLETQVGSPPWSTRLLVIATETPRGLLALPRYPAALGKARPIMARLAGLTWGAEDLGADLGALARHDAAGELTFTFQLARSSCLLAAAALGVQAIDGVHTDLRDVHGLQRELRVRVATASAASSPFIPTRSRRSTPRSRRPPPSASTPSAW